ncbi:MAG: flagellar hook-basal body complex protein [Dehalococcoidia bacterium]|nr:flagellar hook-basal body complex protein [Dehalococcoidia bacterium]
MTTILGAAASGMIHNASVMDTISHNLSNANTSAFKKTLAGASGTPMADVVEGAARLGVAQTTRRQLFDVGAPQRSEEPLHFAITDDTFFRVTDTEGAVRYTRYGALQVDTDGNILAFGGQFLEPPVTLPAGMTNPSIGQDGVISAMDENGEPQELAQITLVRFVNPAGLISLGDGLYGESVNSGASTEGTPGTDGFGPLATGAVEGSNVDIAQEFTNMIIAQRAYGVAAKTFMVGDQMLAQATDITQ